MKRNVLCVFSLLMILLVFFTAVSPKVEAEMHTLVDARRGGAKGRYNFVVANIALEWKHSDDKLFNIVEGAGWESGLRLAEIPSEYFDRCESHVELGAGTEYWYVYSASREPVLGGAVSVVETEQGEDVYLLWHPEGISSLEKLPNSMEVIAHRGNAALVSSWHAAFPFFEHNMWYTLKDQLGSELRVYSLHDIQQFIRALPWITGVIVALICSILLWGAGWILAGRVGARKRTLAFHALLIAALLLVLPLLLDQFDLPASLMPQESILDIGHYMETFDRITASIDVLEDPTVRNWLLQAETACWVVVGLSAAVTGAIVTAEGVLCHRREKKPEQDEESC